MGLGLYIAHEIATAHGGTLDVASTPEETRFTFRMPTTVIERPIHWQNLELCTVQTRVGLLGNTSRARRAIGAAAIDPATGQRSCTA